LGEIIKMLLTIMIDSLCSNFLKSDIMPFLFSKVIENRQDISLIPPFGFFSEYTWFLGKKYNEYPGGFVFQRKRDKEDFYVEYKNAIPPKYKRFFQESKIGLFPSGGSEVSIYSLLDKECYISVNWPNLIPVMEIYDYLREKIKTDIKFIYLQIFELDKICHLRGINHIECVKTAKMIDNELERIYALLEKQYDKLDVVIFGDHGFVDVQKKYDIIDILERKNVEWGKQGIYFVDSTVVRFWNMDKDLFSIAKEIADDILGAFFYTWKELHYIDNRFGDYYIQLPIGAIFHPSFFASKEMNSPKGMHGYWRDKKNNSRLVYFNNYNIRLQGNYILKMEKLHEVLKYFLHDNNSQNFNTFLQLLI